MDFSYLNYLFSIFFNFITIKDSPLHLTPFLNSGDITKARTLSYVHDDEGIIPQSHAGFITVDQEFGNHLFFWYFPTTSSQAEAPLLVWLNGGPGVSSMVGLLYENGPLRAVAKDSYTRWKSSWTKSFSMLYIDNPVGCGFSYTDNVPQGYRTTEDGYAKDLYSFLEQFYIMFPEFLSRELYIGGQSYAGKYISAFGYLLHSKLQSGASRLPFTGIFVGGAFFDPFTQLPLAADFFYAMGAMSLRQWVEFKEACIKNWPNVSACMASNVVRQFDPNSTDNYMNPKEFPQYIEDIMNLINIKKGLHAGNRRFQLINKDVRTGLSRVLLESSKANMAVLMDNYKVLLYDGDFDATVPTVSVEGALLTLPWSHQEAYNNSKRNEWHQRNRPIGFFSKTGNFCRVVLKNAGHNVPHDQPDLSLTMMEEFVSYGCISKIK